MKAKGTDFKRNAVKIPSRYTSYAYGDYVYKEERYDGREVFVDNVLVGYDGCEKEVIVPEGIMTIGSNAFRNNTNLEKIVLPESMPIHCDYRKENPYNFGYEYDYSTISNNWISHESICEHKIMRFYEEEITEFQDN